MAKPTNKSPPKSFEITISLRYYRYLTYLATNGIIDVTENAIAAHLVIEEIKKMIKDQAHKYDMPQA
ncbi:MAG: hypothetical protein ACHQRJ_17765 [Alphaproteobacteria bacterium]